jgi:hypothetical protein
MQSPHVLSVPRRWLFRDGAVAEMGKFAGVGFLQSDIVQRLVIAVAIVVVKYRLCLCATLLLFSFLKVANLRALFLWPL